MILLARPRPGLPAAKRIRDRLAWLGGGADGITVLEGDLDRPGLGLSNADRQVLRSRVGRVIHCAADTSFAQRNKARSEQTNVNAVSHVMELLKGGRCRRFHHMSTAYVAGRLEGTVLESFFHPDRFHNVYEETKWRAEQELEALCRGAGMALSIYRPSVIYGDSRTGRCVQFHGLYYPVRILLHLRDLLVKDLQKGGGKQARLYRVSLDEDDRLHMPVRFEARPASGMNLIPIDHLIRSVCALLRREETQGIYHIVSHRTYPLSLLIEYVHALYPIRGLSVVHREAFTREPRSGLERLLDKYLGLYNEYMQDLRRFDDRRARPVLESAGLECPELTFDSFARCMTFAQSVQWGRTL